MLVYFNKSLKNRGHPELGEQWDVEDEQQVPIALQVFSNVSWRTRETVLKMGLIKLGFVRYDIFSLLVQYTKYHRTQSPRFALLTVSSLPGYTDIDFSTSQRVAKRGNFQLYFSPSVS